MRKSRIDWFLVGTSVAVIGMSLFMFACGYFAAKPAPATDGECNSMYAAIYNAGLEERGTDQINLIDLTQRLGCPYEQE